MWTFFHSLYRLYVLLIWAFSLRILLLMYHLNEIEYRVAVGCCVGWSHSSSARCRSAAEGRRSEQSRCRLQHWLLGIQLTSAYVHYCIHCHQLWREHLVEVWMCHVCFCNGWGRTVARRSSSVLFVSSFHHISLSRSLVYIDISSCIWLAHLLVQSCWLRVLLIACMQSTLPHRHSVLPCDTPLSTYLAPSPCRICLLLLRICEILFSI